MRNRTKLLAAGVAVLALMGLTACGQGASGNGQSTDSNPTIGVLFPDSSTPHWQGVMWPATRDAIKKECPKCKVLYGNVPADAAMQQNQAQSMLAQGAKTLILAPVNSASSAVIVNAAKSQKVPVLGFGSVPEGPAAGFVGNDVVQLGEQQGTELLKQLTAGGDPKRGCVIALDGDAQTPASALFIEGRKKTLDSHVNICKEVSIPSWSPANAQTAMDQAITAVGKDKIIGVYTMNDGIASGASASMKAAGFATPLPPMGGQDADLAGVQRILTGLQSFSLNPRVASYGPVSAPVALSLARGEKISAPDTIKNQTETMPWFPSEKAYVVTKDNIQQTIIDDKLHTYDEICTAAYLSACQAAGLHK